jgi:hypothetical protein
MIIIKYGTELDPVAVFILLASSISILIYAIWLVISVLRKE